MQVIKAMIVDDEPDVRLLFEMHFRKELRKGDVRFHFELSGEGALDYLEKNNDTAPYLILSDINMPGMNGLELLQKLKIDYPHLEVYMITAYGDENTRTTAQQLGCDAFLTKPLDFNELKEKLLA